MLTLTATPIPRTLQMALAGVKEMSIIATAPVDRLAVRSFVMPYDPVVIREALLREHHRGGQTFYVSPRIGDLEELRVDLKKLVPEIKVGMAHGQMAASELEKVMSAFDDGAFDVLLSTNIIESAFSVAEDLCRRVKRWREGDHRERWAGSALLLAESKFRRLKGYREIPQLLTALADLHIKKGLAAKSKTA